MTRLLDEVLLEVLLDDDADLGSTPQVDPGVRTPVAFPASISERPPLTDYELITQSVETDDDGITITYCDDSDHPGDRDTELTVENPEMTPRDFPEDVADTTPFDRPFDQFDESSMQTEERETILDPVAEMTPGESELAKTARSLDPGRFDFALPAGSTQFVSVSSADLLPIELRPEAAEAAEAAEAHRPRG
jgi:hypothetical protein